LYSLERRLVGIWNWSGRREEKKSPPSSTVYGQGKNNRDSFNSDGKISE
jgi:hypothetical protein